MAEAVTKNAMIWCSFQQVHYFLNQDFKSALLCLYHDHLMQLAPFVLHGAYIEDCCNSVCAQEMIYDGGLTVDPQLWLKYFLYMILTPNCQPMRHTFRMSTCISLQVYWITLYLIGL